MNTTIYNEQELRKLNRKKLVNLITYYCTKNKRVMKWFDNNDYANWFYGYADEYLHRLEHIWTVNHLREEVWEYQTIAHKLKRNQTIVLRTDKDNKIEEFKWIADMIEDEPKIQESAKQLGVNPNDLNIGLDNIFKQCEYYKSYSEFVGSPEYKKFKCKQKLNDIDKDFV